MTYLKQVFFSIITVCKNEEKRITRTIGSIREQTYKDYEHIIIDGKSSDNTLEVLDSWKEETDATVISERDSGIYNAMNKGIGLSHGKYIYFLNAGDIFADDHVLERIHGELADEKTDFWAGAFYSKSHTDCEKIYPLSPEEAFAKGNGYVHQTVFAKKNTLASGFDEKYRIHADLEWEYRVYFGNYNFKISNILVSVFDVNGISGQAATLKERFEELDKIWKEYCPAVYNEQTANRKQRLEGWKNQIRFNALKDLFFLTIHGKNISMLFEKKEQTKIGIFGYGYVGQCLKEKLSVEGLKYTYVIDNYVKENETSGKIYNLKDTLPCMDLIIVTSMYAYKEVKNDIENVYGGKIISLEDILNKLFEQD